MEAAGGAGGAPGNGVEGMKDRASELLRDMLILGCFAEGTKNLTPTEIKFLLVPFFGLDAVEKATKELVETVRSKTGVKA